MQLLLVTIFSLFSGSAFAQSTSLPDVWVTLNGHPHGAFVTISYDLVKFEGKKKFNHCPGADGTGYKVTFPLEESGIAPWTDSVEKKMPDKEGYTAGVCHYQRSQQTSFTIALSNKAVFNVSKASTAPADYTFETNAKVVGCFYESILVFKDSSTTKDITYSDGQPIKINLVMKK